MTTKSLHSLEFECIRCKSAIHFSLLNLTEKEGLIHCPSCEKPYSFQDQTLKRQLKKFEDLCLQIKESEEILANTSVAVTLGSKEVEVPYKLLLTRLNSKLHLKVGLENLPITFHIDPLKELPQKADCSPKEKKTLQYF